MTSVVVNFFNNQREARNTLFSLTRQYQLGAAGIEYEVLVVDNGSSAPLAEAEVRALGPEFSYRFIRNALVSPAQAINAACRDAAGDRLLVIIDGAHILSPGVLKMNEAAFKLFPSAFVATAPFHLGPKLQIFSIEEGYNQSVEDELLRNSHWKSNGYRLFGISSGYRDASLGWFGQLFESNCIGMRKADFLELGGFDERYVSPGGGFVNLDFFQSAVAKRDMQYVMLLGEGTFHQVHGGVASNAPVSRHPWDGFHVEYQRLRGVPFKCAEVRPFYLGSFPPESLQLAVISAQAGLEAWRKLEAGKMQATGGSVGNANSESKARGNQ